MYTIHNIHSIHCVHYTVTNTANLSGISLMIWLLGYELRDTIMLFSMEDIFVISSKKKTDFLRPLRDVLAKKENMPKMTLLTRMKVCVFLLIADYLFSNFWEFVYPVSYSLIKFTQFIGINV